MERPLVLSPCCLVRELNAGKRPRGRFGYGVASLARRSNVDAYKLWCVFLFNHIRVAMDATTGDGGDDDGVGGDGAAAAAEAEAEAEAEAGAEARGGRRRRRVDLNWDEDMISEKCAFLCASRGSVLCEPCA